MLNTQKCRSFCTLPVAVLALAGWVSQADATTWDLATDFDTFNGNPNSVNGADWEYGYIDILGAFVPFDTARSDYLAGGGPNPAWVDSTYDPPPNSGSVMGLSRADIAVDPSIAGWAVGKVGGHTPSPGGDGGVALAARWTAPATASYDITGSAWQAADYPTNLGDLPGGDKRNHELILIKNGTSKATGDLLHHTPITNRNGLVNPAGGSGLPEVNSSPISDSTNPTSVRLAGVPLNVNDQIVMRVGNYAANANGFMNLDLNINNTLANTTVWDLAADYSQDTESGTATGIGSDGAWAYGYRNFLGNFEALDAVDTAAFGGAIPQWDVNGGGAVPLVTKTADGTNPLSYNGGTQQIIGDFPAGKVTTHTPGAGTSATKTTIFQWTAPRNMTVNLEAELWKVNNEPAGNRRIHGYDFVHNGTVIQTGAILQPEQGFNSGDPTKAKIPSLVVSASDTVELRVRPLDSQTETYVGAGFRIAEGASATPDPTYARSAALDLRLDYSGAAPQNNPNGAWSYMAPGDIDPSSPGLIVSGTTFGVGTGWTDPGNLGIGTVAQGGPQGSDQTSIVGHGPSRVAWTAPADIDQGGVELDGFISQLFEDDRKMRLSIFKNDVTGATSPLVIVDAPSSTSPINADFDGSALVDGADFLIWQRNFLLGGQVDNSNGDADLSTTVDGADLAIWDTQYGTSGSFGVTALNTPAALATTQVAIVPGDTLTFIIAASGDLGFNPAATFASWDVVIREITFPLSAATSVPEPTTLLLLAMGACWGGAFGRKRAKIV